MLRGAVGKVMWVGRATVFLVGLSVILALMFGVASTAFAHGGYKGLLHLGHSKTSKALTTLVGTLASPVLKVDNNGTGPALQLEAANGPALSLGASANNPPLLVNAEAWHEVGAAGEPAFYEHAGGLPAGTTIKFVNFGSPYNTVGFYKDPQGIVHLKGLARFSDSRTGTSGTWGCGFPRVFQLPQGYRPAATEIRPSLMNDTLTRIDIGSDGLVGMCDQNRFIQQDDWLLLDGISFRAAN